MTTLSSDLAVTHRQGDVGSTVIQPDGAYCTDVLRVVRGTPNPDELAALVTVLLFSRRTREEHRLDAPDAEQYRPTWPRERHAAPGPWVAGS